MLRVAGSLTAQPADAHDLVQETLLRAWRSFDSFDGRHPRAWLLTIMRNANRNSARKNTPYPVDPTAIIGGRRDPEVPSAEATATETLFDSAVESAMALLKPEARRLLLLVDVDGLTYAETAAVLGIPEGTVMSRLHRARKKIRRELKHTDVAIPEASDE